MLRKELTEKLFGLQDQKASLKDSLSKTQQEIDKVEQDLISCMQNEELEAFKDERFGTVFMRSSCRAQIEDSVQAFPWLRKNGYGDIIKESVHASTLSAVAREIPEEIPGVKRYDFIQICRRKA